MFSFFRRKKEEKPKVQRNLFEELFPLSEDKKKEIESSIDAIQKQIFGEEGFREVRSYQRNYPSQLSNFGLLTFDSLGWQLKEESPKRLLYVSPQSDVLEININKPNGTMERAALSQQITTYRNWLRNAVAKGGGGLIFCEEFNWQNDTVGYESITKMPREKATGMDYNYFLNISDFENQELYQIMIWIFEMSPTGMRDNVFLSILDNVLEVSPEDYGELFRQDPYDKHFTEGNTMNLSEREEFDYLFPFHPLSIIRQEIRPRLKEIVQLAASAQ